MDRILALMVPITALMIPIVAILVSHQQKMAQIMQGNRSQQNDHEINALRAEVRELKEMVHQQMLVLDSYSSNSRNYSTSEDVRDRMAQS